MRIRLTDNLMVVTDRFNVILMELVIARNRKTGEMYDRWGTSNHTKYFRSFKLLLEHLVEEQIMGIEKIEDIVRAVEKLHKMIAAIPENVMRAVDDK